MIKTRHLLQRLADRNLAVRWVEDCIVIPDWTTQDADPALTRSFKAIAEADGRVLRVVHRLEGSTVIVIAAFFDRGAKLP